MAAVVGTGMVFNWMYTPWLSSYRNNKTVWFEKGRWTLDWVLIHSIFSILYCSFAVPAAISLRLR